MKPKSLEAKNKIIDAALELMQQQGYEGMTVEEIITAANISVGTFYHYFKSKADILQEAFRTMDKYFEEYVVGKLGDEHSSIDRITQFFHHYALHTTTVGIDNIRSIYSMNNPMFKTKRQMEVFLEDIIHDGQAKGEITTSIPAEEIRRYFFILIRGVIFDWCVHAGSYNLEEEVNKYIKIQINAFKPLSSDISNKIQT
ncbi:TetR/AcrR family transcriptional regulator [Sporomusa acidovorans]|uniref:HTH-type transcriptional regulator BetI n=1 Tax=Sporomusa acidovorans (strain ATCC 49682 / DSM 3132 / Mol) TaxID=1123286 RepID=A0ABZ3J9S2_SPOA4|nr:TetR/AcrR family transcriptional regulator [Sporomusa acidovorans]OZC16213.1 transcriptional regulator AcuR [Sporomusa acidovorans DSM 3132]SDE31543.1 transcriptional regulator, TetR family [Sporomusa acidovorans]